MAELSALHAASSDRGDRHRWLSSGRAMACRIAAHRRPEPAAARRPAGHRRLPALCDRKVWAGGADAARAERGGALRPAAVLRRPAEIRVQGADHPGRRRQGRLPAGAAGHRRPGAGGLGGHSRRPTAGWSPTSTSASSTCSPSPRLRRLRHHHGRLGVELEVSLPGALRSAAQMVSYEVSIGFVIITVMLLRRLAQPDRHRQGAGQRASALLRLVLAAAASRCSSSSSSRRWPRPTGRRSICPKPSPSWWPASGRIFLHALPAVHAGRVCRHRPDVRAGHRCCSSAAGCRRSRSRPSPGCRASSGSCSRFASSSSCSPW